MTNDRILELYRKGRTIASIARDAHKEQKTTDKKVDPKQVLAQVEDVIYQYNIGRSKNGR